MEILDKYFDGLSDFQRERFVKFETLFREINDQVNLVSRRDMEHFWERHVLHSLGIAKVIHFQHGTTVLDAGSGGGFPGIPLAILFPDTSFHLLDATAKKVRAVEGIADMLGLENATFEHGRLEDHLNKYDYVTGRAVTALPRFCQLTFNNLKCTRDINPSPGILYIKGGDFDNELLQIDAKIVVYNLSDYFTEPFFETKKVVYVSPC